MFNMMNTSYKLALARENMNASDIVHPSNTLLYSLLQWQAAEKAVKQLGIKDANIDPMYFHSKDEETVENFAYIPDPDKISNAKLSTKGHGSIYNRTLGVLGESGLELKLYNDSELGAHLGIVKEGTWSPGHVWEAGSEVIDDKLGLNDVIGTMHEDNAKEYLQYDKEE
jgi:hypothetical protein